MVVCRAKVARAVREKGLAWRLAAIDDVGRYVPKLGGKSRTLARR
jgi:hypothetical protein